MTARFRCATFVAARPQDLFRLAVDMDVHAASMAASAERAVGGVTSGPIGLDETVTWRARHFGVTWRMTTRITVLEPPALFVDEQVAGPFKHFRHVHTFEPTGTGTRMLDDVELSAPVPLVGPLAERMFLERYLRADRAAQHLPQGGCRARRRPHIGTSS